MFCPRRSARRQGGCGCADSLRRIQQTIMCDRVGPPVEQLFADCFPPAVDECREECGAVNAPSFMVSSLSLVPLFCRAAPLESGAQNPTYKNCPGTAHSRRPRRIGTAAAPPARRNESRNGGNVQSKSPPGSAGCCTAERLPKEPRHHNRRAGFYLFIASGMFAPFRATISPVDTEQMFSCRAKSRKFAR
jgi:hypothetical protein